MKQTGNPFCRLVKSHTVSSSARKTATKNPTVVPDALDMALASTYDHHAVWDAGRAHVVKQQQQTRVVNQIAEFKKDMHIVVESRNWRNRNQKESNESYRNDALHIQLGIPPHHTASSRRGFGRSLDGCFYSS